MNYKDRLPKIITNNFTNRKTYLGHIYKLESNGVFVFGSNPQGWHGKGAAKVAKTYFGAKQNQGAGLMGQSYGIVTKDMLVKRVPSIRTSAIKTSIHNLYKFAKKNKDMEFYIAYDAKSKLLSGFTNQQMANIFYTGYNIPENIIFEDGFCDLVFN